MAFCHIETRLDSTATRVTLFTIILPSSINEQPRCTTLLTNHSISLTLAVNRQYIKKLFLALTIDEAMRNSITGLHVSNLEVSATNRDFHDLFMFPIPAYEPKVLVKIDVKSMQALRAVEQKLAHNESAGHYILPKLSNNIDRMITFDLLLQTANSISTNTSLLPNIVVYTHEFTCSKVTRLIVFHSFCMAEYDFSENLVVRILESSTINPSLYVPVLAWDVETIADNLYDIPTGLTKSEKLVMYAVYTEQFDQGYAWMYYLTPDVDSQKHERDVCRIYNMITEKLQTKTQIVWDIKQFESEFDLIYALLELLVPSFGQLETTIAYQLTGSSTWPYFLVCHNLLGYDLSFIAARINFLLSTLPYALTNAAQDMLIRDKLRDLETFKFYNCSPNYQEQVGCITNFFGTCSLENFRFYQNAFSLDSLLIFKHRAEDREKMSLKHLTEKYLPKSEQKLTDVDIVALRVPYFYHKWLKMHGLPPNEQICNALYDDGEKCNQLTAEAALHKPGLLSYSPIPFFHFLVYQFFDVLSLWKLVDASNLIMYCKSMTQYSQLPFDVACMTKSSILIANVATTFGIANNFFYSDLLSIRYMKAIESNLLDATPVYQSGKKKKREDWYPGAAVIAKAGAYRRVIQVDFGAYYPSMEKAEKMGPDNTQRVSAGFFLKQLDFITKKYDCESTDYVLQNMFQVYIAEEADPLPENWTKGERVLRCGINCFPLPDAQICGDDGYLWYLYDLNHQVGTLITQTDVLANLNPTTPLIVKVINCDTKWVYPYMMDKFVNLRVDIKKRIKMIKKVDPTANVTYLNVQEHAIKILNNSMYGTFKHSAISVAAAITLLCRKLLIYMCRATPALYLLYCLDRNLNLPIDTTREEIEMYLNLLRSLSAFTYASEMEFKKKWKYSTAIHQYCTENVVDADTDGYEFLIDLNDDSFSHEIFTNNYLNKEMIVLMGPEAGKELVLEGAFISLLIVICKKRYLALLTQIDKGMPLTFYNLSESPIFSYKQTNYGKNAIKPIKFLMNYILDTLVLCKLYDLDVNAVTPAKLGWKQLLFSFFNFLRLTPSSELGYKVKINTLKSETTERSKFIKHCASLNMTQVQTYYAYNPDGTVKYITEKDYGKEQLHYLEYIKNYIKIIFTLVSLIYPNQGMYSLKSNDLLQIFQEWLEASEEEKMDTLSIGAPTHFLALQNATHHNEV